MSCLARVGVSALLMCVTKQEGHFASCSYEDSIIGNAFYWISWEWVFLIEGLNKYVQQTRELEKAI